MVAPLCISKTVFEVTQYNSVPPSYPFKFTIVTSNKRTLDVHCRTEFEALSQG